MEVRPGKYQILYGGSSDDKALQKIELEIEWFRNIYSQKKEQIQVCSFFIPIGQIPFTRYMFP